MSKPSTVVPGCKTRNARTPLKVIRPAIIEDIDCLVTLPENFQLDRITLDQPVSIKARLVGPENAPVVLCLGGISANRYVCDSAEQSGQKQAGWWREIVGAGNVIDTRKFRVLSFDFFPGEDHLLNDLPSVPEGQTHAITPNDQARIAAKVCEHFGIAQLHAFAGSSYGGMVALAFGKLFPQLVAQLIVICAAHRPHPMGTAWRSIQRKIVRFGLETGRADRGLSLARELGMTTYRTAREFNGRFDNTANADCTFEVEDYLETRGEAFVHRITPARYLCLSESIDRHYVEPEKVDVPVTLISFTEDQLVLLEDARELKDALPQLREYHEHPSIYGHDAFLKENDFLNSILHRVLHHPFANNDLQIKP